MPEKMSKKKNRLTVISLALGICLIWMSGPALAGQGPAVKTIRIITPEWEGQTNGDGTGFFFDVLRAVYTPSGIQMEFTFAPWKRCQIFVNSGRADAMLAVWKNHADDQNQLTPQYPIFVEEVTAVYKKASLISWQGIHTLDYKRAVWMRGYDYHKSSAMTGIQLAFWNEVDSYEEAWRQLNLDRVDIYIETLVDLNYYIQANTINGDLYHQALLWRQNGYVAFANIPRSKLLIDVFNREILKLAASGRLAEIHRRWNLPFFEENWQPQGPSQN